MDSRALIMSLYLGPALVMAAVNDAWREAYGVPALGIPLREAWTDPVWRPVQQAMDDVYRTGVVQSMDWAGGRAVITPVSGPATRGLVVVYEPAVAQPTPVRSRRALRRTSQWAVVAA